MTLRGRIGLAVLGMTAVSVLATPVPAGAHAGNDDPTVIHACISPGHDFARIVGVNEACGTNESPTHWNIAGPQGPKGDKGDRGAQGDPGTCEQPACGNGILEYPEQCDGQDLAALTCDSFLPCPPGHTCDPGTGSLSCSGICTVNSKCQKCGNGVREGREECDGGDMEGDSCQARGYDTGFVFCLMPGDLGIPVEQHCRIVAGDCENVCGNGICRASTGETCANCPADCGACP